MSAEITYRDAGVDYAKLDAFKRKCMAKAALTDTFMQRPPSPELLAARNQAPDSSQTKDAPAPPVSDPEDREDWDMSIVDASIGREVSISAPRSAWTERCPSCWASPGEPCRTRAGVTVRDHKGREVGAPCGVCGSLPGHQCRSLGGGETKDHKARERMLRFLPISHP